MTSHFPQPLGFPVGYVGHLHRKYHIRKESSICSAIYINPDLQLTFVCAAANYNYKGRARDWVNGTFLFIEQNRLGVQRVRPDRQGIATGVYAVYVSLGRNQPGLDHWVRIRTREVNPTVHRRH